MNAYSVSPKRTVTRDSHGPLSLPDLHRNPLLFNNECGVTLHQHRDQMVHDLPVSRDLENGEVGGCAGAERGDVTSRATGQGSLPDLSRKRPIASQSNNEFLQTLRQNPYQTVDELAGEGMGNGDVRKRTVAEGGQNELGRFRVRTAKGVEHQKKVHNDSRVRAMKRLNRLLKSIESLLVDHLNVE